MVVVNASDDTQAPHLTAKLLLRALEVALWFCLKKKKKKILQVFLHLNERSRERESKTSLTLILRPAGEEAWEYRSSGKITVKARL